ncbi:uncharacterized protein LOC117579940 [Drosophila guanche]|uniref:Uncharacterized protein n=1 Tax=Drosophila guanche TaxID=7266 RepID=A0A3B0JUI3_DROGU|nr:uncharacterized protein LOC117579940 [Drosophila guanche]SPP77016.1 Hypothetical predicted protein [Drosophila guanche]
MARSSDDSSDDENEENLSENRQILNSIDSFEELYKTYRPKDANIGPVPSCSMLEKSENKSKSLSRPFSNYRIALGQGSGQQQGTVMDHQGYSFSEYPICRNSSRAQLATDAYMPHTSASECCYWSADAGGQSQAALPESGSRSEDTIVNHPGVCAAPTSAVGESQSHISTQCCPMGSCCFCRMPEQGMPPPQELSSSGPMTYAPFPFMPMGMPMFCPGNGGPAPNSGMYAMPNGGPAPNAGMYAMQTSASANGMYAAAMGMDQSSLAGQRGLAGQAVNMSQSNAEINNSYDTSSTSGYTQSTASMGSHPGMPAAYQPSMAGCGSQTDQSCQAPDAAAAYEYVQKYNQNIQQYLATAQQNVQQSLAQAQHATPQVFNNLQPGMGAQPYYPGIQDGFSSSMGPQQYLPQPMSMSMPAMNPTAVFGMNAASSSAYYAAAGGAINDTLQTQTVYSSDYKPIAAQGNNFNHFPNGMDIGLSPDSCSAFCAAETGTGAGAGPGAFVPPEMCSQLYGMSMNMGNNQSFPLNQMNYASYPCEMQMPGTTGTGGAYDHTFINSKSM